MEKVIINVLKDLVRKADIDTASLSSIRRKSVEELNLSPDFFKSPDWKVRSKQIIGDALTERVTGSRVASQPALDASNGSEPAATQVVSTQSNGDELRPSGQINDDDVSELSDVLDEEPPIKKVRKYKTKKVKVANPPISPDSSDKKNTTKATSKTAKVSSKTDEISRLKSNLLKCGIRKQWAKILDPMPNDNARIKYLKEQLEEIGIVGRFNLAKAKKIKEQREFNQDLHDLTQEAESFTNGPKGRDSSPSSPVKRRKRKVIEDDDIE